MRLESFLKLTPLALFFLLVTFPTLSLQSDMWDGVLIEYAALTHDFSGFLNYSIESTWFLQYPLGIAIINLSEAFGISYVKANALVVFFFMYILLRETLKFAQNEIKLSKLGSYFALTFVAIFSTWGDLLSSLLSLHFGCIALGFLTVRVIHKGSKVVKIVGFVGLIGAFSLLSQLVFLTVLSYIYDLSNKKRTKDLRIIWPSINTIIVFSLGFIFYITIRFFYSPHGLYLNYNNIVIGSLGGIISAVLNGVRFSTYLAPIVAVVFLINLLTLVNETNQRSSPQQQANCEQRWLIWLLILFFAGAFPYMAVGKASFFGDIKDWTSRQAFLLAVPTALFSALYLQILHEQAFRQSIKNVVIAGGVIILALNAALLAYAVAYKVNRQVFVAHLEQLVKNNEGKLPPGLLEIVGDGIPAPSMRVYESNLLMYKATGKANWWTSISNERDNKFTIPCHIQQKDVYQLVYIYNYNPAHNGNHTLVKVRAHGFTGPLSLAKNLLGLTNGSVIELISVEKNVRQSAANEPICK